MKPELTLLFEIRATLESPIIVGDVPEGKRRVVPVSGGTFTGPRLRGTLVPGGADWQYGRLTYSSQSVIMRSQKSFGTFRRVG